MNTIEIKKVLLKRGNTAQSEAYTGLLGEVTIDTDLNCLRIHDGETPGGEIVAVTATTTQALIEQAIADLLNGAPEALDTLKELADAFGENSDSIADILTTLANKANSADLATVATSGSYDDLTDKPAAFDPTGLATEAYVDTSIGDLDSATASSLALKADISYVDSAIAAIPSPDLTGLATETYVDEAVASSNEVGYLELTNYPFITAPAVLGTPVEFVRTASGTETDAIDTGLTLARGSQYALYNIDSEVGYDNTNHTSPAGTEWNSDGWGDLLNLGTRSYTTLRSALGGSIGNNIIGAELIMHDTINDKYYKFAFSDWGQNNGGSFAYTRTQVTDPNYFVKTDYGSQVDIIVPDDGEGAGVAITRGDNQGIYNPYREGSWDSATSPGGTQWNIDGWDDLSDVETRVYTNFYAAYNANLGNVVPGSKAVMYVPDTGKYYAIEWLSWTQNNAGGGFSYTRRELDITQLQQGITFADGTVLTSADGVGRVKSTASAGRRIEEVTGESTVSVTQRNTVYLTTTAGRTVVDDNNIWIVNADTTIDEILNNPASYGITDNATIQFSLDNVNWYVYNGYGNDGTEMNISVANGGPFTYNQGDTIYFKYDTGAAPVVWWDRNDLPSGSANFRGAVIDYHAFTGEATWIGTIHIVDDDGDGNIAHTEVSSGSTDSENDDLWLVENEGTISYRRIDGEAKTLKIHWTAKVFYGEEIYD
jgi:hypothetical protein